MKLLFDENLSPRLPRVLSDLYPGSTHVHERGLGSADDSVVWQYAKEHGFILVSKDCDFQDRSILHGTRRNSYGFALRIAVVKKLKAFCERLQR